MANLMPPPARFREEPVFFAESVPICVVQNSFPSHGDRVTFRTECLGCIALGPPADRGTMIPPSRPIVPAPTKAGCNAGVRGFRNVLRRVWGPRPEHRGDAIRRGVGIDRAPTLL